MQCASQQCRLPAGLQRSHTAQTTPRLARAGNSRLAAPAWKPLVVARPLRRAQLAVAATSNAPQQQYTNSTGRPEEQLPQSRWTPPSWLAQLLRAAAVCALTAAVALSSAAPALAARSGGRIGGSSFGRSSYSASSSWSGGGGSWSSSKSSYGSPYRSLGGGLSSGRAVGSSLAVNSFFFPTPWGFGGYGVGYPMGGGMLSLLFWGVFAVILLQVLQGVLNSGDADDVVDERVTVAKVQVGLLGSARDLQRDLERIASRADTSTSSGLHYILQETVLSLMRNPDYCVYGFAKSKAERSAEDAEQKFNELSLAERGKFQAETLSNVGGRSRRSSFMGSSPAAGGEASEYIVVTLLVAADGPLKLPRVTSRAELSDALAKLGAVRQSDLLAVEVLWTPEEEGDYFTQLDLAKDYPLLNTL